MKKKTGICSTDWCLATSATVFEAVSFEAIIEFYGSTEAVPCFHTFRAELATRCGPRYPDTKNIHPVLILGTIFEAVSLEAKIGFYGSTEAVPGCQT